MNKYERRISKTVALNAGTAKVELSLASGPRPTSAPGRSHGWSRDRIEWTAPNPSSLESGDSDYFIARHDDD